MSDTVRRLPWGAERHIRSIFSIEPASSLDATIKPGEYTLNLLLNQFFIAAEARIADVCSESKQVSLFQLNQYMLSYDLCLAYPIESMFKTW